MRYTSLFFVMFLSTSTKPSESYQRVESAATKNQACAFIKSNVVALAEEYKQIKIKEASKNLAALQAHTTKEKIEINTQTTLISVEQMDRRARIEQLFELYQFDPAQLTAKKWFAQLPMEWKKTFLERIGIDQETIRLAFTTTAAKKPQQKKEKPLFEQY